ncbi:serine/threonine protein kinase [Pyxidicoccus sp. 3LG]
MSLNFPADWRFAKGIYNVPEEAKNAFEALFTKIASSSPNAKAVYEMVKRRFGMPGLSSSESWAQSDMETAMRSLMDSAPEFAEAIWLSIQDLREAGRAVPSLAVVNQMFTKTGLGFIVDPPRLVQHVTFTAQPLESEDGQAKFIAPVYVRGPLLGQGAYGQVYKTSRNTPFGSFDFALKIHSPSAFIVSADKARARFHREVAAVKKLQHRGIVPYLDAGTGPDGELFLAMPFIDGANILDATPAWDEETAIRYMTEVLLAIAYAHSCQVLHRDLKPSNIIVRSTDDQPMVLDFGQAYLLDEAIEAGLSTQPPGTPGYIPPEVMLSPQLKTVQHDLFSCGVLLYELLARRKPFDQSGNYVPLRSLSTRVRRGVDGFVKKAVTGQPSARFQSAAEMLAALRGVGKRGHRASAGADRIADQ